MSVYKTFTDILARAAYSRNFLITLVLAAGLAPVFVFPEYNYPLEDVTEQLYPFIMETKRMLATGSPWWTWGSFLGDNFIGSYAYYTLTRPLTLAVCLLPYRYILAGLAVTVYLNFLILGWLVTVYLRLMGYDRRLCLIGSLLFTLSDYMISHLCYCMFFEPVEAFVVLLICIERFLRGRRYSAATLTLASFAVAFVNYYFMAATLMAGLIYYFCRLPSATVGNRVKTTLRAAGCVALGVAMASVVLMPVMMYLSGTNRVDTVARYVHLGYNWLLRGLSLVAPPPMDGKLYLYDIDSGWNMNIAYVGVFGVLPFILYGRRHPRSWLTILCAVYIVCFLTPLNGIFCLFTHPYYSRWVYALILMLTMASLSYFREGAGRCMPLRATLIYAGVAVVYFCGVYFYAVYAMIYMHAPLNDDKVQIYIAAAVLLALNLGALLWVRRYPMLSARWMRACIVAIIAVTVVQHLHVTYRMAKLPLEKNNLMRIAADLTASRDTSDIFVSRLYYRDMTSGGNYNLNHQLLSNRHSVVSYISTTNSASAPAAAVMSNKLDWWIVVGSYPESTFSLLSVKDIYGYGNYPEVTEEKNALYIPMGMAYDRYALADDSIADIERSKTHDIYRGMLATMVIDPGDEPELRRYMTRAEFCDTLPLDSLVAARRAYVCETFAGDSRGFTATVELPDTMAVMFSVAADPGFTATIDGAPARIYDVNLGMSATVVPAGRHTIRYEYFPPGLREGALMSLAAWVIFLIVAVGEARRARRG